MATGTLSAPSRHDARSTESPRSLADRDALVLELANLASRAGKAVMAIYGESFRVHEKPDGTPLTEADLAADAIIADGLAALAPQVPVLSEETAETVTPESLGELFFVVDPLDGTREFVDRNGEFSINIALVEQGVPVAGIVYAPALRRLWLGGTRAFATTVEPGAVIDRTALEPIATCPDPLEPIRAVASRSHRDAKTQAFLRTIGGCQTTAVGSALKFCLVAEGRADVYPRFGPTMVWDTAAGMAVLLAAGGQVVDAQGRPLQVRYAEQGWRNGAFTAWGCEGLKNRTGRYLTG